MDQSRLKFYKFYNNKAEVKYFNFDKIYNKTTNSIFFELYWFESYSLNKCKHIKLFFLNNYRFNTFKCQNSIKHKKILEKKNKKIYNILYF